MYLRFMIKLNIVDFPGSVPQLILSNVRVSESQPKVVYICPKTESSQPTARSLQCLTNWRTGRREDCPAEDISAQSKQTLTVVQQLQEIGLLRDS